MKRTHQLAIIATILGIGIFGIFLFSTNTEAQAPSFNYANVLPIELINDVTTGKFPLLNGTNLNGPLSTIANQFEPAGGFFTILDPTTPTMLFAFITDSQAGEIKVYRYDVGGHDFLLMDCATAWGDSETSNIQNGILINGSSAITTREFLQYYKCEFTAEDFAIDDAEYDDLSDNAIISAAELKSTANPSSILSIASPITGKVLNNGTVVAPSEVTPTAPKTPIITGNPPAIQLNASWKSNGTSILYNSKLGGLNNNIIIFKNPDKEEKYFLDVWRLEDDGDYVSMGLRLYEIKGTQYQEAWPVVTYGKTYSLDKKLIGSQTKEAGQGGVIIKKDETIPVTFSSGNERNKGNVIISIRVEGDTFRIDSDFSKEADFANRTVTRFVLSDDTLAKITALPEYNKYKGDVKGLYESVDLRMELRRADAPFIFLGAAVFGKPSNEYNDGPQDIVGEPYFKSSNNVSIKTGVYDMVIQLDGYKEIIVKKAIHAEDLSSDTFSSKIVANIKELTIDQEFVPDPCWDITDLSMGLACVDNRIVERFLTN